MSSEYYLTRSRALLATSSSLLLQHSSPTLLLYKQQLYLFVFTSFYWPSSAFRTFHTFCSFLLTTGTEGAFSSWSCLLSTVGDVAFLDFWNKFPIDIDSPIADPKSNSFVSTANLKKSSRLISSFSSAIFPAVLGSSSTY